MDYFVVLCGESNRISSLETMIFRIFCLLLWNLDFDKHTGGVCLDLPAEQRLAQANTLRKLKLTRCDLLHFPSLLTLPQPPSSASASTDPLLGQVQGRGWTGGRVVGGGSASLGILWGTPAGHRLTGSGATSCVCCSSSHASVFPCFNWIQSDSSSVPFLFRV